MVCALLSILAASGVTMTTEKEIILNVDDLSVRLELPSGAGVEVLQNVSFSLRKGDILGLIGESGAGKSMIGRSIMNALPSNFAVTNGSIHLKSTDITHMTRSARKALLGKSIAYIPQEPQSALNPVMSIGQHFHEHLTHIGVARGHWRVRALELLESVQIRDPELVLGKFAHELSGGMCQRILIAMAFAARPSLIIADEATTALDPITQANVIKLLRNLQREHGTSVVFVTHDLRLAAHVCDHVLVLFGGQPLEYGGSGHVIDSPVHPYTQSLKATIPSLEGDIVRLPKLADYLPSLRSFMNMRGCRFAARSTYHEASYGDPNPPRRFVGPGHWVRWADDVQPLREAAVVVPIVKDRPGGGVASRSAPLLVVSDLQKSFVSRRGIFSAARKVVAARDVELTLAGGEILGVVGLSGSGKSTLAKMLVGLERPDSGKILLEGADILADDPQTRRKRITNLQMIFQNSRSSLNPRMTIGDLATQIYDGLMGPVTKAERRSRAQALLRDVGLPADVIDRYPDQLSGGQRQRVGIARALCIEPRILVADEIVSGLDVSVQAQVLNLLLDIRSRTGVSIVFISHDLSVVRYLCDRTIVMQNGSIVESGETETLLRQPQHDYTRALLDAIPPENMATDWKAVATA